MQMADENARFVHPDVVAAVENLKGSLELVRDNLEGVPWRILEMSLHNLKARVDKLLDMDVDPKARLPIPKESVERFVTEFKIPDDLSDI